MEERDPEPDLLVGGRSPARSAEGADEVLGARLRHLGPATLAVARAAAVLGDELRFADVGPVAGLDADQTATALDDLVTRGVLIEERPGWAAFTPASAANALRDSMGPASRARLHERAFRHLASTGQRSAAVAHAEAAALVGDAEAVAVATAAGRSAAAAGAVATAVAHLESARALAGEAPPAELLITLAEALVALGRPQDAADGCRAAAAHPDATVDERLHAFQLGARALAYAGHLEEAAATGRRAHDLARRERPAMVAAVVVDRVHAVWQIEGPAATVVLLDELGMGAGDDGGSAAPVPADLAATRHFVRFWATGDPAAVDALAVLARAAAVGTADQAAPFEAMLSFAAAAGAIDRLDESLRTCGVAEERARRLGIRHAIAPLEVARAVGLGRAGRLGAALAAVERARRETEVVPLMIGPLRVVTADVLAQRGRIDEAAELLADHRSTAGGWMADLGALLGEARIAAARGDAQGACTAFAAVEDRARTLGVVAPGAVPWASGAVDALLGAGRHDDVARIVAHLEPLAPTAGGWTTMVLAGARAGLAAAGGDREGADAGYATALAEPTGHRLDRARIALRHGDWLRRSGRIVDSRPVLADVVVTATEAGAVGLEAVARAALAVAGGRAGRTPVGALTPQERRVATLAAAGLSTSELAAQLFVSPKTVESHLTRIYAKLGVTTKRALRGRRFDD